MSRDEQDDAASPEDASELETRILGEEEAAELETRVLGEGTALDSEAATVLAVEDDQTQLVTRGADGADADAAGPASEDPSEAAEGLPETRVLDPNPDKTRPPAVIPAAVAGEPAAAKRRSPATRPNDPTSGLQPGTVLFGEYEIVSVLGVGGMGEVYRARHRRLDEFRAIKVMHAELSKKQGASEFFYREAKALLAVRHPAVVHCHDLLSDDEGHVYLVMEMIEGVPLSKKMNEGPLSPDDVAILGARVSHGLSAAHRRGVIHRDVSPDNIVLPNGRVQEAKIIDFGIAKILEQGEGTIIDGFKGKLSYASPEQLGFFNGKIDGRSDFYSLGLVLVAAALGRPMGMGTTVMEAVDARRSFQTLPDEIPVGLRSAIQPLLALDPKDRPKYVDRLFVVPGGGIEATEPGGYGSPSESASERSALAAPRPGRSWPAAAAAIAGMVLLGGSAYWWLGPDPQQAAGPDIATAGIPTPAPTPTEIDRAPVVVETGIAEPSPEPVVAKKAPAPKPKRLSASDRIKIIGLLSNAKMALGENRLMSPAGDNAYERYRRVLDLDPSNAQARSGLRAVADRYLGLADASVRKGDASQAREYLDKAREADSSHPELSILEARLIP